MTRVITTELAAYRAAAAELPLSASLGAEPAGAVVVVPGLAAVRWAIAQGAAAVVVADVSSATSAEAAEVTGARVPIVLARPRLRADESDSVSARAEQPRHVVADVVATPPERAAAVADAAGWIRILTGGVPTVRAVDPVGLALLDGPRGEAITLTVASPSARSRGASLRVEALGEARVTIAADGTGGDLNVTMTTSAGALRAPRRWETTERHALRRALAALNGGPVTDLGDLAADLRVAEALDG